MTTYRLPDGTRVDSIDPDGRQQIHGSMTWITHPELGPIAISTDKLTEVEPPLPPQPEYGEFVACGTDGNLPPGRCSWRSNRPTTTPATARGIAAAIWRAAREVEQP